MKLQEFRSHERSSSRLRELWLNFTGHDHNSHTYNGLSSQKSIRLTQNPEKQQNVKRRSTSLLCGTCNSKSQRNNIPISLGTYGLRGKKYVGRGAYGKVILCQVQSMKEWKLHTDCPKPPTDRKLAIKCISDRYSYQQEVRVLKKISLSYDSSSDVQHPLFPFFYTNWVSGEKENLIAMEFLENGTLQQLVTDWFSKGCRFRPRQIAFYLAELTEALMFLHDNGIIHADLKPSNVLLRTSGHICLSDFGNSIVGVPAIGKHIFVGQALLYSDHMAPELRTATETVRATWAADLFSLGVIGYYMHHNCFPYGTADSEKELLQVLNEPVTISKVRGPQADLLHELLEIQPEMRPRARDVLLHRGLLNYLPRLTRAKNAVSSKDETVADIRDVIKRLQLSPPCYNSVMLFSNIVY